MRVGRRVRVGRGVRVRCGEDGEVWGLGKRQGSCGEEGEGVVEELGRGREQIPDTCQ